MNKTSKMWFKDVTSFDEIFEQIENKGYWHHRKEAEITSTFKLDNRFSYLEVKPTEKLFEMIDKKVIAIDYDMLSFESINLHDGSSLIKAVHSIILGSHDIAIIDTHTIPGFEWTNVHNIGAINHV